MLSGKCQCHLKVFNQQTNDPVSCKSDKLQMTFETKKGIWVWQVQLQLRKNIVLLQKLHFHNLLLTILACFYQQFDKGSISSFELFEDKNKSVYLFFISKVSGFFLYPTAVLTMVHSARKWLKGSLTRHYLRSPGYEGTF